MRANLKNTPSYPTITLAVISDDLREKRVNLAAHIALLAFMAGFAFPKTAPSLDPKTPNA
ncbi:MAG: hypothetical protein KGL39_03870 [Patescibacteria group bacterium]|nr:hypothetical protein [Patescibacteria group bacterium]